MGKGWAGEKRRIRRETHCSIHGGLGEGDRQRGPHHKEKCMVGYLKVT